MGERQVEALLAGHINIAWNTPLAHVRVQRRTEGRSRSLGIRDADRDFHSKIIVRRDVRHALAHLTAPGGLGVPSTCPWTRAIVGEGAGAGRAALRCKPSRGDGRWARFAPLSSLCSP